MKEKIKAKTSNNKILPKIKYSASGTRTLPKFGNQQSQNFPNNHYYDKMNIIQPNINFSKEEHKLLPRNNFKIKSLYNNNINNNEQKKQPNNDIKINYYQSLKYLLKEFGLSEYLRKFNELGYDNNNYLKLGTLSAKNFNNLLNIMHIFPGHTVKMEKFYEYLKSLNNSKSYNKKNNTFYKKKKLNYGSMYGLDDINKMIQNNLNKYNIKLNHNKNNNNQKCLSPRCRPKTSHFHGSSKGKIHVRSNYSGNKIIKRNIENFPKLVPPFVNESLDDVNKVIVKSYLNNSRKVTKNQNLSNLKNNKMYNEPKFNLNKNLSNYNNNIERQKELEEKINQNIEKMLDYYMVQLNDKLNNSYESVDDSSLSYIITSQMNEQKNNKEKNDKDKNSNSKNNLPSISQNIKDINLNKNKNKSKPINILKNKNGKELPKEKSDNSKKDIKNKIIEEKGLKDSVSNNNKNEEKENNENKNEENKNNEMKVSVKEIKKENPEQEIKNVINQTKIESSKENKKLSEPEISTKSKDSKEHIQEDIEEEEYLLKEKKQSQNNNNNKVTKEKKEEEKNNNEYKIDKATPFQTNENNYLVDDRYSLEQNIFDSLRLNKSMDFDNIDKDTLKFDIEFMCRCLGLALYKLIEQGQEKQHLTELKNYKFSFFNPIFNKNINLIQNFFDQTFNSTNNAIKLGDLNLISPLEKLYIETDEHDNDDLDIMKHIKKSGDENIIQNVKEDNNNIKLKTGFNELSDGFRIFGDFFSYGRKKTKNYQNISENTKKILCKDLSFIKEIDSEMNRTGSRMNSKTSNNNNGKNNSQMNDSNNISNVEKNESESDIPKGKNDSKNNIENKTKIIGGDEKEEDYNFEDEMFLNDENNIEDKNEEEAEKKEEEEIKNEENEANKALKELTNHAIEMGTNTDTNLYKKDENLSKNKDINLSDSINEIESNYIIDIDNMEQFKQYLLKQFEVFDEDYIYYSNNIPVKRFMSSPDPQSIFEFCANIMILTKMEKDVLIISLIYIERLIFNTGFILNSRNWRKIIFISLIIASKIWDDDSLENIHFSQIFTHLKISEINLLERIFIDFINYKTFIKYSEYMKYYLEVKNLALKYNYNGEKIVPVSVEKMMKIQEYAYQMQKRLKKKDLLNNSAHF